MAHFLANFGSGEFIDIHQLPPDVAKWDELFCFEQHRFHGRVPPVATRVLTYEQEAVQPEWRNYKFIKAAKININPM